MHTLNSASPLSDAKVTVLIVISFGLDSFENGQADLGPISHHTPGLQMPDISGFAIPVEYADVGVSITTND
jgi:hypothetical protein